VGDGVVTAVSWPAVVEVLTQVEALPPEVSGTLAFGDTTAAVGAIFVERGRVCWVAARGLRRRLRDLLQQHAAIPNADLDRVYERCRAERKLLGETLVAEGWIDARDLEAALRWHSAESLAVLCADPAPAIWSPRTDGYHPVNSFTPSEVLDDVIARFAPDDVTAAAAELDGLELPAVRIAAFATDRDRVGLRPVAFHGVGATVAELATLAQWARALPLAGRELGTSPRLALATTAAGDTIASWWNGGLLYTALCTERAHLTRLAARHLGARAS
jgi:hypothetical protein